MSFLLPNLAPLLRVHGAERVSLGRLVQEHRARRVRLGRWMQWHDAARARVAGPVRERAAGQGNEGAGVKCRRAIRPGEALLSQLHDVIETDPATQS